MVTAYMASNLLDNFILNEGKTSNAKEYQLKMITLSKNCYKINFDGDIFVKTGDADCGGCLEP